jgi:hypothetical protein
MFVPDPVISLSIKPEGQETPNFSRALNRFQKEDPTFKVHIDQDSKEVRFIKIAALVTISKPCGRPSFLVWASYILKFM